MSGTPTAEQITKTAMVLTHIKNNNVSYLVGLLVLHTMGVIAPVMEKASGVCG
jgi:hypothetical protein